jgi:hypothetical protein
VLVISGGFELPEVSLGTLMLQVTAVAHELLEPLPIDCDQAIYLISI